MSQNLPEMATSLALNQARADAAIEKHDKLCRVMQELYKVPEIEKHCNCTKIQGNWNCKFNNW